MNALYKKKHVSARKSNVHQRTSCVQIRTIKFILELVYILSDRWGKLYSPDNKPLKDFGEKLVVIALLPHKT